jgi:outer membrane protein assembly factor BamB
MRSLSVIWRRRLFATLGVLVTLALAAGAESAGTDWPGFRGPRDDGHAVSRNLPVRWSETENVTWKTAIPNLGWSTPVIMAGRIWLTSATADGHDFFVICVDAVSGKVLLNEKVFHADDPEPLGNATNCYASPSAVLESGRVYVHFGTYGTACLDADTGKVLWKRDDFSCRHYRGPGSSPMVFEDLLVLSFDGVDVQYVVALNKNTGQTVWKTDRSTVWHDLDADGVPIKDGDRRKAFSTPLVIDVGGKPQIITLGAEVAFAYDPRTGAEIWKVRHEGHSSTGRPVYGDGLVFVTTGYGKSEVLALRVDGEGDVTDTHVAWRFASKDEVPQMPSPVLVDGLLYMVSNNGAVTCMEAATGEQVWSERPGGTHMASPIYADGKLYFFSVQGEATVLKAGRKYELVATNELDEGFMASPAVSGKALFLRTKTHLYRIESNVPGGQ